jgi:CRP-like cAMP-binding protein
MAQLEPAQVRENRLLATLPEHEIQRIAACLELVSLKRGETLYRQDEPIDYVYFPTGALCSLVASMKDGTIVEVGVIGREGLVGLSLVLGSPTSPRTVLAQAAGSALRLPADNFRRMVASGAALSDRVHRFIQIHLTQTTQWVACNRLHSLEERLARWLLASADATGSEAFELTQDFIAQMLGVRRPSVTVIMRTFESAGLVQTSRGRLKIVNRPGLEKTVCECYQFVQRSIEKTFEVPEGE